MRYIIITFFLIFSTFVLGQELYDPIIIDGSYKVEYKYTEDKSFTRKCFIIDIFVDKSIPDSVGLMGTQSIIATAIADSKVPYNLINIFPEYNVIYLDYSFGGTNNGQIINDFAGTAFTGDVAMLVTFNGSGGIAFLRQLDRPFAYAVSTFQTGSRAVYTGRFWNGMVSAHEVGHVVGSRHTHDNAWNGNDTPIDSCAYGVRPTPNRGTVMSYCHFFGMTDMVFHPQVANVLHAELQNFTCGDVVECENAKTARIILNDFPGETTWKWGTSTGGPYPKDSTSVTIKACASECDTLFIYDSAGDGLRGNCSQGYVIVGDVEYTFYGNELVIPMCTPPVTYPCVDIDSPRFYDPQYAPGGNRGWWIYGENTLTVRGNIWTSVKIEHRSEGNSVLRFDIKSDGLGEIQGVAISKGYNPFGVKIYNIAGTDRSTRWDRSIRVVNNVWSTVEIPIPVGDKRYIWLINDKDLGDNVGETSFRNVCIVEQTTLNENAHPDVSGQTFNVLGQPVDEENLIPGVYIKNGKKFVIINPR